MQANWPPYISVALVTGNELVEKIFQGCNSPNISIDTELILKCFF